ncbi:MAG: DUF1343 domain-containing protein, partial [Verrucomicrobia bacterium]
PSLSPSDGERVAGRPGEGKSAATATNLPVLNGIDVLKKQDFAPLKGKRIGLITNQTGRDREGNATIDLLKNAADVKLVALFSPEHGIRGVEDKKLNDSRDEKTGLRIYSLYGKTTKPTREQLRDLDALVFDIQDVGCRFYTFISTMGLAMEAAAESGKQFIVLDRVNPINGSTVDGPVLDGKTTFVGFHQIPLRYGMTAGELAKLFNVERKTKADLTVIPLENWRRELWFDETALPWINPSPNMRSLKAATLYPGVGLLESALSVGRGTATPFELVGAPYIDEHKLAQELYRGMLPGVSFAPVRFTPTNSVHKGKSCGGVFILVTNRDACNVVDVGLLIAKTVNRLYPKQFPLEKLNRLLLHRATLDALKADKSLADIRSLWTIDRYEFQQRRERYLIYP